MPTGALFITFEGLDGCGKSTQMRLLAERLERRGIPAVSTREPGGTDVGVEIREIFMNLDGESLDGVVELFLLFAARRQNLLEVIDPALERGEHVLCDRFTDSSIAYQGGGRGVPRSVIDGIDRLATGTRGPDLTVLLDVTEEAARERGLKKRQARSDRIDREAMDFYSRVRASYLDRVAEEPDRFLVIDASGTKNETKEKVWAALLPLLGLESGEVTA